MAYNKSYSFAANKKNDPRAKALAKKILWDTMRAKWIRDNSNEGKRGSGEYWDQEYELPNGTHILVEVERKDGKWWGERFWPDRPFKYYKVDIPFRKGPAGEVGGKNLFDLYILISMNEDLCFMISKAKFEEGYAAVGKEPKKKKCKNCTQKEDWFSIPHIYGRFYMLEKVWRKWARRTPHMCESCNKFKPHKDKTDRHPYSCATFCKDVGSCPLEEILK